VGKKDDLKWGDGTTLRESDLKLEKGELLQGGGHAHYRLLDGAINDHNPSSESPCACQQYF